MNLRKKFLLVFLSVSLIPILIFSLYTYTRYTHLVKQQVAETSANLLDAAASQVNNTLSSLGHIVETMYLSSENHTSMVDDLKKYAAPNTATPLAETFSSNEKLKYTCQSFLYASDYINGIFLFTPNGTILGHDYGNGSGISNNYTASEEDWYQKTLDLQGQTYIYGPSEKEFFLQPSESVSFCTSLYDVYTRKFLGVLLVDCSASVFDLSSVNTLPDIAILSVVQEEQILYSNENTVSEQFNAKNALEYQTSLSLDGLSLQAVIDRELLYREFGITQITLLSLAVTCILVIAILSILLSKSLTKPITYLSRKMGHAGEDWEDWDVSDSPYFDRRDEIGTLYNSYQEMLDERNDYIKNELENKLILLDSQMKSLESQINAHFLYNTLESINSIASIENVPRICTMAMALGRMFRYSIKTKSELVPLEQEITHVKDYVSIQQIRFNNAFSLVLDIPECLYKKKVLKLILQPLVENALYHGLDNCQQGDRISISARAEGTFLKLLVSDNGVGMSCEDLLSLRQALTQKPEFTELGQRREEGIGVKNIHTRISLYYGSGYGLQVASRQGEGTSIFITLPLMD